MDDYVKRVNNRFPMKISKSGTVLPPDGSICFEKCNSKIMGKKTEQLRTSVARVIFVAKRVRPDIHKTVAVGQAAMQSVSRKQKLNTINSTEA